MSATVSAMSSVLDVERRNSLPHWVYFAGGFPPDGDYAMWDRQLFCRDIPRAGWVYLQNYEYPVPNQSAAALEKENEDDVPSTILWVKHAAAQADELGQAYGERGLIISRCLIGIDRNTGEKAEKIILPNRPATLIQLIKQLENPSTLLRIESARDDRIHELATKMLAEMLESAEASFDFMRGEIDKAETERIERSKPNGVGKVKFDKADQYYYRQLELEMPALSVLDSMPAISSPKAAAAAEDLADRRECPKCAEWIKSKASVCHYCGADFSGKAEKK